MSMWDKSGLVRVPVDQMHIDRSMERNSSHCVTAEAIRDAIPDATHIAVDLQTIRFSRKGLRYVFLTPHPARDCIIAFDQGERDAIKPFELRMRPAFIAKAGKKRRHAPSNEELKETGLKLRVNPVQLHVSKQPESNPRSLARSLNKWGRPSAKMELAPPNKDDLRKELALAAANTAKMQNEQQAEPRKAEPPSAPPPQRRVARAMVSKPSKGSVPVTLGGKMPPVSILSRREFGLRVLRK
jgi:hypothetical protein